MSQTNGPIMLAGPNGTSGQLQRYMGCLNGHQVSASLPPISGLQRWWRCHWRADSTGRPHSSSSTKADLTASRVGRRNGLSGWLV